MSDEPSDIQLDSVQVGDCLELLLGLPEQCVDLAYIDPPFATGRRQAGRNGHSFEDNMNSIDAWIAFMRPRLAMTVRSLAPTGAILVHCDWRTSHHVRLMLDELLGAGNFQNHLIWQYGLGGSSPQRFSRKHDDILYYSVSSKWYFDPPMIPATSQRMRGLLKKATDVLDIPSINNMAHERTGWPTQKPLALLELLLRACCPPGGVVLDPMCGSGTTLLAAENTGRRYIGFDRLSEAVGMTRERLATEGVQSESVSVALR